jgi:signal transduction histidine kinase
MPVRERLSTVRFRTTVAATLVVAVALMIAAAALLGLQRRSLVDGAGRNARSRAADVSSLAHEGSLPAVLTAVREADVFTQVVAPDGTVLSASQNLLGEPAVTGKAPPDRGTSVFSASVRSLEEGRFRIATQRVTTGSGVAYVYSGENLSEVNDQLRGLAVALAGGLPVLLVLVAMTTWAVTGRALRPVEAIRAEVEAIGDAELVRRVPEPTTGDEIARLARTMNAMLARLETASLRQRRFVSDAAHELQSPLTTLRARLEVDLGQPPATAWPAAGHDSLEEVVGMQRLVDDLLELARLDARPAPSPRQTVDLDDIALREAERLRTRGRVTVDTHGVSGGQVTGDAGQLRRALRNLLDNAERHAAGAVAMSLREDGDSVELTVSDDGTGVPAEDQGRIFEPFARLDAHRARQAGGTGLGLAITRDIVRAHGGEVGVGSTEAGGARFTVRLPKTPP